MDARGVLSDAQPDSRKAGNARGLLWIASCRPDLC
jgi:hypothetical protein